MRISVRAVARAGALALTLLLSASGREASGQSAEWPRATVENAGCGRLPAPTEVLARGNSIIITEVMTAGVPCVDVHGDVRIEGAEIRVTLRLEYRREPCVQVVCRLAARVTIPDLPHGTYTVRVEGGDRVASRTVTID